MKPHAFQKETKKDTGSAKAWDATSSSGHQQSWFSPSSDLPCLLCHLLCQVPGNFHQMLLGFTGSEEATAARGRARRHSHPCWVRGPVMMRPPGSQAPRDWDHRPSYRSGMGKFCVSKSKWARASEVTPFPAPRKRGKWVGMHTHPGSRLL